ncbi:MAG: hypothetical protein K0S34_2616, partial [Bacillales bacterium]|nr:hypothetical protein [Bacillales bacterium]
SPSPFNILTRVPSIYISGQIQARIVKYCPTSILRKVSHPSFWPKNKNTEQLKMPIIRLSCIVFDAVYFIELLLLAACASDTLGNNSIEIAPVKTAGKRINGKAIPVSAP